MERNAVIIELDRVQHELTASIRDWKLLNGPFFNEGLLFLDTLGVYKNFTVTKGIPDGSKAIANRFALCQIAEQLLAAVKRDIDLIQYNYSFYFTGCSHKGSGAISGFKVDGYYGYLTARPQGFCLMELMESAPNGLTRLVGRIDVRNKKEVKTENWGILKLQKKRASVTWQNVLPPLIEFLEKSKSKTVVIYHN